MYKKFITFGAHKVTMTRKLTVLITLFLVAVCGYAQEGDPIIPEEKIEREVILESEVDSAQNPVFSSRENIINTPKSESLNNLRFNTAFIPAQENQTEQIQQQKEESKKLSYNFLYYLFYKFRKVDNADD